MKKLTALLLSVSLTFFAACNKVGVTTTTTLPTGGKKLTIALLPKSKGNQYFVTVEKGARVAAAESGIELLFDGPTDTNPAKQNEIVENWITLGVDAIAAACENKEGISTALKKAQAKGIKVVTYDSDANADARSFFVNQATAEGIGNGLMDEAAGLMEEIGRAHV